MRSRHGQHILKRQHRFVSDLGDQFTFLNVYARKQWVKRRFMKFLSHQQSRSWCEENGVHFRSLRMAVNIDNQLQEILRQSKLEMASSASDVIAALQECLCEGCVLTLARRCANDCYRTLIDLHESGGTRIGEIHPSSALVVTSHFPRYIVYQEVRVVEA